MRGSLDSYFARHPRQAVVSAFGLILGFVALDAARMWGAHNQWASRPFLTVAIIGAAAGSVVLPSLVAISKCIVRGDAPSTPKSALWGVSAGGVSAFLVGFLMSAHSRSGFGPLVNLVQVGASAFTDVYLLWLCAGTIYLLRRRHEHAA